MKGIAAGHEVYVVAPSGASMNARVHDVDGKTLVLELFSGMRDPMSRLAGETVSVTYASRRGICRVEGEAVRSMLGITTMQFVAKQDPELIQRRDYVRVHAIVPVSYRPMGLGAWDVEAHTIDLSAGGFLIGDPEGLQLGHTLPFTLDIGEGEEPLTVVGKVVRETRGRALGVQIVEIEKRDRERLVRNVFARERLARQIARDG